MFEDKLAILELCYDEVHKIENELYIVKEDAKYGIIDGDNNTIVEKYYSELFVLGNRLYCKDKNSCYFKILNFDKSCRKFLENNSKNDKDLKICSITKISDHGYVFLMDNGRKCLVNSKGEQLLPPIYRSLWITKSLSNKDIIKAIPFDSINDRRYQDLHSNISFITVNKQYTVADGLFAYETCEQNIQIVATNCEITPYNCIGDQIKYRLRIDGKLVGKEYDDIMVRYALIDRGLIEVYCGEYGRMTVGLMSLNGEEIVRADKYNLVSYIGNGITVVGVNNCFGTVVKHEEVIRVPSRYDAKSKNCGSDCFTNFTLLPNLPVAVVFKDKVQYYIGNDGNAYKNLVDAFPIYQSIIDNTVYLINLYDNWLLVDKNLNRLNEVNKEVADVYKWKKMQ